MKVESGWKVRVPFLNFSQKGKLQRHLLYFELKYCQFSCLRAAFISKRPVQGHVCGWMCVVLRAESAEVRLHLNHVHSLEEGLFLSSVSLRGGRSGPGPLTPRLCPILSPNPFFSPAQLLPPSQGLTFFPSPWCPLFHSFTALLQSLSPPSLCAALIHHPPFTPHTPLFHGSSSLDPPLPFPLLQIVGLQWVALLLRIMCLEAAGRTIVWRVDRGMHQRWAAGGQGIGLGVMLLELRIEGGS